MKPIARERPAPHEPAASTMIAGLERVRRFAWRGNGRRALQLVSDVEGVALDIAEPGEPPEPDGTAPAPPPRAHEPLRRLREFGARIADDPRTIPNCAERRRDSEVARPPSWRDRRPSHGGALPPGKQQGP